MGELAALGAAAVWAIASVLFAKVGRTIHPLVINVLKCSIAGVLLLVTLLLFGGGFWPAELSRERASWLALSSLLGLILGDSFFLLALVRLGARKTLVVTTLTPAVTTVLGHFLLPDEPMSWTMALGILVTLSGVLWVVLERSGDQSPSEKGAEFGTYGLVFALLCVFCMAAGNVWTKKGGVGLDGLQVSVVRLYFGCAGLWIVVAAMGRGNEAMRCVRERETRSPLLLATLLGSYLGIWLMMTGFVQARSVGVAATLTSTSPIFVLPVVFFLHNERVSLRAIGGAVIAVVGVSLLLL